MYNIAIVGAVTALVAATIGLVQNDIKSIGLLVSQLGLMF
jgi:NADH-quinone oxidoreductase subunit L